MVRATENSLQPDLPEYENCLLEAMSNIDAHGIRIYNFSPLP